MTKKKRKHKKRSRNILPLFIALFLVAVLICIVVVAWMKMSRDIAEDIERNTFVMEYSDIVEKYSEEYSVPSSIIYAMIKVESDYNQYAESGAGACGLMQLTPQTFNWLSDKNGEDLSPEEIFDPDYNIKYGTYYISWLYERYGNWDTVYAAYNAGHGNVDEWMKDERYSDGEKLIEIPFSETAEHVVRVNNAREKYIEIYELGE